jgi:hypothetical protein
MGDTIQKFINKVFLKLNNEENRKYIQIYLFEPMLNHILERIFPYIILTCVLFIVMILCVVTICIFIYYDIKSSNIISRA